MEGDINKQESNQTQGHSELELTFVLILIGLLGIAFLAWYVGSDGGAVKERLGLDSGVVTTVETPIPTDHVTGDSENIDFLGLVTDEFIGPYFTHPDSSKTLYTSDGDCTGDCLDMWTVYGGDAWTDGDFDTITRSDSKSQYTWLGKGLYTFNDDVRPGDVLGDGYSEGFMIARP